MVLGALAPVPFAARALVFTCPLLLGGLLFFFAKSKEARGSAKAASA
jgi:hypothetical protein